jgi:site-specific DNA-methyltransferase (adenine-specific)
MGSGSTAIAAKLTGRHYVGYELSAEYCALAEKRVEHESAKTTEDTKRESSK